MFIKGLGKIIGSAFLLVSINANAQLLLPGSTPKKQVPVKAAPKPPVKPPSKAPVKTTPPAAVKTTPPAEAKTEEPSPNTNAAKMSDRIAEGDVFYHIKDKNQLYILSNISGSNTTITWTNKKGEIKDYIEPTVTSQDYFDKATYKIVNRNVLLADFLTNPSGSVGSKPQVSNPPAPKKAAPAEPVVVRGDLDQEIILFATLDELKLYKASGNTKKWSIERKILLYNLFRNKQLENLANMEKEAQAVLTAVSGIPSTYETVKESYTKNIFNNDAVQKYTDEQGIKNLQTALNGMDQQTKKMYTDYFGIKSSYEKLNVEEDIKAYHLLMFDKELSGSEKEEINKANAIILKVQSHLKSIYGVGFSAENILNYLYKGLDDLYRKKVKNYPASGIAKVNNFTSTNAEVPAQRVQQNTTVVSVSAPSSSFDKGSETGDLVLERGKTLEVFMPKSEFTAFINADRTKILKIIGNKFSEPIEDLRGHTPFNYALAAGASNETLRFLIENGASINKTTIFVQLKNNTPISPLVFYATTRVPSAVNLAFFSYLINNGAKALTAADVRTRLNQAENNLKALDGKKTAPYVSILKNNGIDLEQDAKNPFNK